MSRKIDKFSARDYTRPLEVEVILNKYDHLYEPINLAKKRFTKNNLVTRDELLEEYVFNKNKLSKREKDVLPLIMNGFSDSQIARKLKIATATAKVHVGTILCKMGVHSRKVAAVRAQNESHWLLD